MLKEVIVVTGGGRGGGGSAGGGRGGGVQSCVEVVWKHSTKSVSSFQKLL